MASETEEIICLNVGGVEYWTTRTTLSLVPSTFLASLASNQVPISRDDRGRIFIDRDGHLFRNVLNYMRNGCLAFTEEPSQSMLEALQVEADFYALDDMKRDVGRLVAKEALRRESHFLFNAAKQPAQACGEAGTDKENEYEPVVSNGRKRVATATATPPRTRGELDTALFRSPDF
jgi:hypothetical protein